MSQCGDGMSIVALTPCLEQAYCIIGCDALGAGGFGQVWKCRSRSKADTQDSAEMVVKIIDMTRTLPEGVSHPLAPDGEFFIHASLDFEHIVGFVGQVHDLCYCSLVLRYCVGGDLKSVIIEAFEDREEGIDPKGVTTIAKHICLALDYLQGKRLIHRDVKCENILLHYEAVDHKDIFL